VDMIDRIMNIGILVIFIYNSLYMFMYSSVRVYFLEHVNIKTPEHITKLFS